MGDWRMRAVGPVDRGACIFFLVRRGASSKGTLPAIMSMSMSMSMSV